MSLPLSLALATYSYLTVQTDRARWTKRDDLRRFDPRLPLKLARNSAQERTNLHQDRIGAVVQ
jgi:hypothetical protein